MSRIITVTFIRLYMYMRTHIHIYKNRLKIQRVFYSAVQYSPKILFLLDEKIHIMIIYPFN